MIPDGTNKEVIVKAIEDEDGRPMESAPHPKQMIYVDFGEEIKEGYLLRRREEAVSYTHLTLPTKLEV